MVARGRIKTAQEGSGDGPRDSRPEDQLGVAAQASAASRADVLLPD